MTGELGDFIVPNVETTGQIAALPMSFRYKPDPAKAEESFRTALAIAREQGTRGYELRAATSLARLWREQGRRGEARDLLTPLYDWFTEGLDTADLNDAKALLDELA
jgi:predicted ATPase